MFAWYGPEMDYCFPQKFAGEKKFTIPSFLWDNIPKTKV